MTQTISADAIANRTRKLGINPRALGTNPRALGTNERSRARNKWALRAWKRRRRRAKTA
jgi:hypothetical protein